MIAEGTAISVKQLSKSYRSTAEVVAALKSISFDVPVGQIVALMGPSGSGKTTLLNILSGWETQDEGTVERQTDGAPGNHIRWSALASVPQRLGLSEELTVRENVELPLVLQGAARHEVDERVDDILQSLDLISLHDRLPPEISLGEQQRASVARALVVEPLLVLADEPTGNQDALRTEKVIGGIRKLTQSRTSCVVATHDPTVASLCDRILLMHDGELVSDEAVQGSGWRKR